jgi:hypothetical protein
MVKAKTSFFLVEGKTIRRNYIDASIEPWKGYNRPASFAIVFPASSRRQKKPSEALRRTPPEPLVTKKKKKKKKPDAPMVGTQRPKR